MLQHSTFGNGNKVGYGYSGNKITSMLYNDVTKFNYVYNANGNLGYKDDKVNNVQYQYSYDIYDTFTGFKGSNGFGILKSSASNNTSLSSYTLSGSSGGATSYKSNPNGNMSQITWNSNKSIDYAYDGLSRLLSRKLNTGSSTYTTSFQYLEGNATNKTTELIKSITNNSSTFSYTYDANNNIETISDGGVLKVKYYYDELNQLIGEENVWLNQTIAYNYNSGGNLTQKSEYSSSVPYSQVGTSNFTRRYYYSYDSVWKDKLVSFDVGDWGQQPSSRPVSYDQIGNPTSYNGWTYTWEAGRQLATASKSGTSMSFKYDDSGYRTQKTVNGVATNYYLEGDKVIYEKKGTDTIYYTYDENNKLISMNQGGTEYYYIRNAQDDIIGLIDNNGTQVVSYTYDSWGKLVSTTGSLASTVGASNPYRYRGYRYDTETGLYYLNSRYYSPEWGRFINADATEILQITQGEVLGANLFAYCVNNAVNYSDPSGEYGRNNRYTYWWGIQVYRSQDAAKYLVYRLNQYCIGLITLGTIVALLGGLAFGIAAAFSVGWVQWLINDINYYNSYRGVIINLNYWFTFSVRRQ